MMDILVKKENGSDECGDFVEVYAEFEANGGERVGVKVYLSGDAEADQAEIDLMQRIVMNSMPEGSRNPHFDNWLAKHTNNGRIPHIHSGCFIFVPVRPSIDGVIVRVYVRDRPDTAPSYILAGEKPLPLGVVPKGWGGGWTLLQDWLAIPLEERLRLRDRVAHRKASNLVWQDYWRGTNAEYAQKSEA